MLKNTHQKNTVRYYVLILALLSFLFFSGDFGMIDVQKTAIVMAVGVDKQDDTFIVTSQIAIPKPSKQGTATQTVQIVSRGKTVADAFEEINAKTGWYPKLVFCRLILLGEKTVQSDVLEALDFFILDEYLSDNCLIATCDTTAKEMLNAAALVDSSSSLAMEKVLSSHAERVGLVLPATLRSFLIGYFSDSQSSFLPVLKMQPQQEQIGNENKQNGSSGGQGGGQGSGQSEQGGSGGSESAGGSGSSGGSSSGEQETQKPVFSASETALFVRGKRVGSLTKEETFAVNAVRAHLKLAAYPVSVDDAACTLNIKNNAVKRKVRIGQDGTATLRLQIKLTAGLLDYSKPLQLLQTKDAGEVPNGAFYAAEKSLSAQLHTAFEKCKACGCDVFGIQEHLQKYNKKSYKKYKETAFNSAILDVSVRFISLR